jgi:hypothetical protein
MVCLRRIYFLPQKEEPFFAHHVEEIVTRQHGGRSPLGMRIIEPSPWTSSKTVSRATTFF